MKLGLIAAGVTAWAGVAALSVLMAAWDEPFWGFLALMAAVFVAWAIGEYVTNRLLAK